MIKVMDVKQKMISKLYDAVVDCSIVVPTIAAVVVVPIAVVSF